MKKKRELVKRNKSKIVAPAIANTYDKLRYGRDWILAAGNAPVQTMGENNKNAVIFNRLQIITEDVWIRKFYTDCKIMQIVVGSWSYL